MNYPIVKVITKDNLDLYGLLSKPSNSKTLYLNIHGTGSSFFCESFQEIFYKELPKLNIDVLFTNNRGSYALDSWQDTGAALDIFEKSLLDIDAWIEWVIENNYTKIILSGHSHGTEKVVYYMNYGKHKDIVSFVVLMGFCDSVGTQQLFEKKANIDFLSEAREKVDAGKGYELLTVHRRAQAGELPISASTYINFFSKDSELSKVTPFRNDSSLPMINAIKVPILATIGDHGEYTIIPITDALALLKKENNLLEGCQIVKSDHCYKGHEEELIKTIIDFLKKHSVI